VSYDKSSNPSVFRVEINKKPIGEGGESSFRRDADECLASAVVEGRGQGVNRLLEAYS